MSKTNHTLTLIEKIQLIKDKESGVKTRTLSEKYKINAATVSRIMRNKDALKESATKVNLHRKRQRRSIHGNLDDALNIWITQMKQQNIELTRAMATQKALDLAKELSVNVYPGSPWIARWLKRVNLQSNNTDTVVESTCVPAQYQVDEIIEEEEETFESIPQSTTKEEICSSEDNFESLNEIKIESVRTVNQPVKTKPLRKKAAAAKESRKFSKETGRNYEKHRWLGDLVVTQMEEVHPDDRADFAWEIHKLIRTFQLKRRNSEDNE